MSDDATDDRAKVTELVERARLAMLTTMTEDGRHVSRPMALQETEFDGDLWFFVDETADSVTQIATHPQVNVSFSDEKRSSWVSISGAASLVRDRAKIEELWSPALEVWFSDGLDTPTLALIKVEAESAEYWDAPQSRVRKLVGAVRAAATGDPGKFPSEQGETRLD